jgi:hypothetical protein
MNNMNCAGSVCTIHIIHYISLAIENFFYDFHQYKLDLDITICDVKIITCDKCRSFSFHQCDNNSYIVNVLRLQ